MHKIAVLTFPGNNCETETVRAIKNIGLHAEVFLWNQTPETLLSFDGVVLPGGFSFEDRGRSGVISAQEPIFKTLKTMAESGTPLLGICNGAQMLVESGLILADANDTPAVALLRNKRIDSQGNILGTGFYHSWRTLKPTNQNTPFSHFAESIHIPLAHGEGRFTFPETIESYITDTNRIVFQYTTPTGTGDPHYPTNPNGSFQNAAAICNPSGNVVAMMPHPERTEAGNKVFQSLKEYLDTPWELDRVPSPNLSMNKKPEQKILDHEVTMLVRLKITDKTEKTFQSVLGDTDITRRERWGFRFAENTPTADILETLADLIQSGEVVNQNKQWVVVQIHGEWYDWNEGIGFEKSTPRFHTEHCFESREKEDFRGASLLQHVHHDFPTLDIKHISFGVLWETTSPEKKSEYAQLPIFTSPVGEDIFVL